MHSSQHNSPAKAQYVSKRFFEFRVVADQSDQHINDFLNEFVPKFHEECFECRLNLINSQSQKGFFQLSC